MVVECDTGRKRAGVETPAEAIALAREIAASKGLLFAGFMLYPTETGWAEAQKFFDEALAGVRAHGLDATMVSTGGTPNLKNVGKLKGATEHRPGTYIYNDRMQVAAGVAGWDDCALHIYSTVVSRAGPDRGILDAGSKTLTSDTGGGLDGHGLILEHPEARIARFAEEHGFLDLTRSNTRPNVGDVVRIVPNHVCVVVNMMDEVVMVRGEEIVGRCRSRHAASCGDAVKCTSSFGVRSPTRSDLAVGFDSAANDPKPTYMLVQLHRLEVPWSAGANNRRVVSRSVWCSSG